MGILQNILAGKKLRKERKVSPYVTMKELIAYIAFGSKREDYIRMVGETGENGDQVEPDLIVHTNSDHINLIEEFLDMSVGVTTTVDLMKRIKAHKPSGGTSSLIDIIGDLLGGGHPVHRPYVDELIAAQVRVYFENIEDLDIGLIQPKAKHYRIADPSGISEGDQETIDLARYLLHGRKVRHLKGELGSTGGDSAFDNTAPSVVDMISESESTYDSASVDSDRLMNMIAALMTQHIDDGDGNNIIIPLILEDRTVLKHEFSIENHEDLVYLGAHINDDVPAGIAHIAQAMAALLDEISEINYINTQLQVEDSFLRAWFARVRSHCEIDNTFELAQYASQTTGLHEGELYDWLNSSEPVGNGHINSSPTNPDRLNSPNLSVIVIPGLDVNLSTRNTSHVALFSSGIPTVEMSLAAPFLKLQFEIAKASVIEEQASLGTTITFLGDGTVKFGSSDWGMQTGLGPGVSRTTETSAGMTVSQPGLFGKDDDLDRTDVSLTTRSGIEAFTSPQTMVNMNINSQRSEKILDPTQPMMSLDSVQIKEYLSGHGLIGFKRATVSLTLHDRTRLREVAHFIAPAQFGRVTAGIEFGWSHPHSDPAKGSPYGKFLNSLRNTAKYRLIKGNYNMDASGQIKITLEMGTTGGEESKHIHACTGRFVEVKLIEDLLRDVNAIHKQRMLAYGSLSPDIFDYTTLYERSTDLTHSLVDVQMLIEAEQIYRDMIHSGNVSHAAYELASMLKVFIETGGSTYRTVTSTSLMGDILDSFEPRTSPSPDPFLADLTMGVINSSLTDLNDSLKFASNSLLGFGTKDYVSLGKVMTTLIGKPLCASHRFDEVQMIFYGMNDSAGAMVNYPISSFPVDISSLRTQIMEYIENAGTITVAGVIRILTGMTNSASSEAYGFSDLYRYNAALTDENRRRRAEMGGPDDPNPYTSANESFKLNERLVQRMYQCGLARPRFKVPVIKVHFESGPQLLCDDEGQQIGDVDDTKHILRIHVYDQNASAHPGEQVVLDALSSAEETSLFDRDTVVAGGSDRLETVQQRVEATLSTVSTVVPSNERDISRVASFLLGGGNSTSLEYSRTTGASNRGDNQYDSLRTPVFQNISRDAIHDFIKTRIPTIQFGTAFSPYSEVTISGMSSGGTFDALLSNQFRDQRDPQTNQGSDPLVSEVTVVPVTAKVAGLGNPMFHPGQEFYMDLKTGTTADNIFAVRSVTHNISPGTFKSDIEFGPAGAFSSVSSIRSSLISALSTMAEIAEEGGSIGIMSPDVSWGPRPGTDEFSRIEGGTLDNGGYADPPDLETGIAGNTWTRDEIRQLREQYPDGVSRIEMTMRNGWSLKNVETELQTAANIAILDA